MNIAQNYDGKIKESELLPFIRYPIIVSIEYKSLKFIQKSTRFLTAFLMRKDVKKFYLHIMYL